MSARMKEKPLPVLPSGHWQLMEFAIGSIRDTSGVNLELLGQKQNDQAGVLEYQRKQAAMTILATLFCSTRCAGPGSTSAGCACSSSRATSRTAA